MEVKRDIIYPPEGYTSVYIKCDGETIIYMIYVTGGARHAEEDT